MLWRVWGVVPLEKRGRLWLIGVGTATPFWFGGWTRTDLSDSQSGAARRTPGRFAQEVFWRGDVVFAYCYCASMG